MKFLIIKTSSLGDIIQSLECVVKLKKKFPNAAIDWVVEKQFADIVQRCSLISKVYTINSRLWRKHLLKLSTWKELKQFKKEMSATKYEAVFDLQGNLKSSWFLSQVKATDKVGFGIQSLPEWPNFLFTNCRFNPPKKQNIKQDYLYIIETYLSQKFSYLFSEKLFDEQISFHLSSEDRHTISTIIENENIVNQFKIIVCPGSNWANKQLPIETLLAFLQKIKMHKKDAAFLFVWGNDKEQQLVEKLHTHFLENSLVVEKLALPLLQHLMSQSQLVISMDSLPLHLCGTTATASFSIFGPSLAQKYAPIGLQHDSVQGICPYGKTFEKRCPILRTCSTGQCMKNLDADFLFKKIAHLLT